MSSIIRTINNSKRAFSAFCTNGLEKVVKAAVVGSPNAGKSTLINSLAGNKIFPVSPKVHTTRQSGVGVFVSESNQVILIDTPGLIPYQYGRRLKMPKSCLTGAQQSTEEADLILVVIDASNKRTRQNLDQGILDILTKYPDIPTSLILNKVDLLNHKHVLLTVASVISEEVKARNQYGFKEVFMISAVTGDGVDDVRNYLLSCCTLSPWKYNAHEITDQSNETIVEEIIRERLFHHLDKEIPYIIKQSSVIWDYDDKEKKLSVLKNLECKKSSQVSIVIGPGGETIQKIISEAKDILETMLKCTVDLQLNVRANTK